VQSGDELPFSFFVEEHLVPGRSLGVAKLANTPTPDRFDDLTWWVMANEAKIQRGTHVMPDSLLAQTVSAEPLAIVIDGASAPTIDALSRGTCNGCHTMNEAIDGSFHVSPLRRGDEALSPFLKTIEIPRRANVLRRFLCR